MYSQDYRDIISTDSLDNKLQVLEKANKEETKLRELFVTDRSNILLEDDYLNLISVHDNYDIFTVPPNSTQEDSQAVIMTKTMDKLQVGDVSVVDKDEFKKNFNVFTEGMLDTVNWKNLFLAGGSVLAMLTPVPEEYRKTNITRRQWFHDIKYKTSDIDLYIYGLDEDQATQKLYEIYESVKKVVPKECTCIRSSRAITIVSQYPYRHIQIIIRLFKSPAEVLMSFDVDSCCVGFNGKKVFCTPRSHYSIVHKKNFADLTRRSFSYEYRLKKYNERGYAVVIPEYDPTRVNYRVFAKMPNQVTGLARLLVLENIDDNVKHKIYRDVLNLHQCTMYRNMSTKSTYEVSDYSLVFLPWGKEFDASKIKTLMTTKNQLLNKDSTVPQYVCFVGSMYEVVRDNNILKPDPVYFKTPQEEDAYYHKYVCDTLSWTYVTKSVSNFKLLTSFNHVETTWDQWYKDAYYKTSTDELCDAVSQDNINKVKELINSIKLKDPENSCKVYLNDRDIACRNSLHLAVQLQNIEMCKLLLEEGADPMTVSKLYKTALHTACEVGNVKIIELLINYGSKIATFNPHKRDSYKLSPILYTIMYGNYDAFVYMYKNVMKKHTDLVWIFKHDKIKSYRALEMCLMFKRYNIAEFLLDNKYDRHDYYLQDLKVTHKSRRHILQLATELRDLEFMELLLGPDQCNIRFYKDYIPDCTSLLTYIQSFKKIDRDTTVKRIKYTADIVEFICSLADNTRNSFMGQLLSHFIKSKQFDLLKTKLEEWDLDITAVF